MPNQRAPGVTPRTVAFPDELWERAVQIAAKDGTTVSAVVRKALEDYVWAEDYLDERKAR